MAGTDILTIDILIKSHYVFRISIQYVFSALEL